MEKMPPLVVSEQAGHGTMSSRRGISPQRRSNLSRNQSFSQSESEGSKCSLISRLGNGASSPSFKAMLGGEPLPKNTRYQSLSELVVTIPSISYLPSDSFGTNSPRTPMRDALVEKAVCAYLQPSESFHARNRRSGWGICLFYNNFFSNFVAKFYSAIPNPIHFFSCAVHCISLYLTRIGLYSS